jgi:hypothetical protein
MSPRFNVAHSGLFYTLSPDLRSPMAMDPVTKIIQQLPVLLSRWPLTNANLLACVGALVACVRRDPPSLLFGIVAGVSTVGLSAALLKGRYFMRLVPTLLALGVAGWVRFGGRLRIPALLLLLAAPLLPSFPGAMADIDFQATVTARVRQAYREGQPTGLDDRRAATERLSRCLTPRDIVLSDDGAEIVWLTGAVAIQLAGTEADFWTIVDEYPVGYLRGERLRNTSRERLAERFRPRPDCGPDLYQRRDPPS